MNEHSACKGVDMRIVDTGFALQHKLHSGGETRITLQSFDIPAVPAAHLPKTKAFVPVFPMDDVPVVR